MKVTEPSFDAEAIELEKIYRVRDLRISYGYSAFETSFLLGRRDFYVRDAENPLHTLQYSVNENNYLRQIFNCSLRKIMPGKVEPTTYQIRVLTSTNEAGLTVYKIERQLAAGNYVTYRNITEEPKEVELPVTDQIASAAKVNDQISKLFSKGYFSQPKTALTIFRECKKELKVAIRPLYLAIALGVFTGKRKGHRLVAKTNESGRMVWQEVK